MDSRSDSQLSAASSENNSTPSTRSFAYQQDSLGEDFKLLGVLRCWSDIQREKAAGIPQTPQKPHRPR